MATPQMPNMPGAAVMTDTLDFVKNLWGSMSVPGMNIPGITTPTLSVDELDKKIGDLKAVEAWLSVNMSMLRGTVQALEVQRGTIATLKSMGASLAAAVKQPDSSVTSLFESIPYASAFFPMPVAAKAEAAPTEKAAPEPEVKAAPAPAPAAETPDTAAQMTNPAAWWNLLQDQFKQAVSTTMASDALAGAAAMASDAAAKFTAPAKAPAAAAPAKAPVKAAVKRAAAKPRAAKVDKL